MGWLSEVSPHEGWVGNVVADGRVSGSNDAHGPVFLAAADGTREHLPWDQVVAWRVMCECGWSGPSVPAVTDPKYGFRDCPDEIADGVMRTAWSEHVAPFEAVLELAWAARAGGVSWSEIGTAAGLTRQGAQQRWGRLEGR